MVALLGKDIGLLNMQNKQGSCSRHGVKDRVVAFELTARQLQLITSSDLGQPGATPS